MRDPALSPQEFIRDQVLARQQLFSGEDLAQFNDGILEEDGFRLTGSGKLSFSIQPADPDLSRFNSLSIQIINRSSAALLVGVRLSHVYDEDRPGLAHVSLSGGREELLPGTETELKFPAESFGTYGTPDAWTQIRDIEFTFCREKHYRGPDDIDITVLAIDGELRKISEGPRLTKEGLATVLKQEATKATSAFSRSLAKKGHQAITELRLLVPPPHPYPGESADEVLSGNIMGQRLGREIQWDANPPGFLEWTHFLNRCHFMRELVLAYVRTGEDRYVGELDRVISSWIKQNPVPIGSNGGAGAAWETLSVAWRLREWLFVVEHVWKSDALRESTKKDMLRSIWEHAASLMDHKGHPNNWIIVESASLALAGLAFPEFHESNLWVEAGVNQLQSEFSRQFFSDGVHFEISPLYHAMCFHAILEVKLAAGARGVSLPQEFGEPLERCAEYLAALCRPDFSWPSLNDSGSADQDYTALMLLAGEVFQRADLIWIGSRGTRGDPPVSNSTVFSDAGIAVMRSDYRPDANFLVFRSGPAGASHVHEDALSLDVTALGKPRLLDPGITTYAPDRLTQHYRSAPAHNTILVNGRGRDLSCLSFMEKTRSAGEDFSWRVTNGMEKLSHNLEADENRATIEPDRSVLRKPPEAGPTRENGPSVANISHEANPGGTGVPAGKNTSHQPRSPEDLVEIASGVCRGPWANAKDITIFRTVHFVRGTYWIVQDEAGGTGEHEITVCWQFAPGRVEMDLETFGARFVDLSGPSFEIIPLLGSNRPEIEVFTGSFRPPRGWVSTSGTDIPATSCAYNFAAKLPITLAWLLIPYSGGPPCGVQAKRINNADGSLAVEVVFPEGWTDRFELIRSRQNN
jgi:hypothetical protein